MLTFIQVGDSLTVTEVDTSDTRGNTYITFSVDDGTYITLIATPSESEYFEESEEDVCPKQN